MRSLYPNDNSAVSREHPYVSNPITFATISSSPQTPVLSETTSDATTADGRCMIAIDLEPNARALEITSTHASQQQVSLGATLVYEKCMQQDPPRDGKANSSVSSPSSYLISPTTPRESDQVPFQIVDDNGLRVEVTAAQSLTNDVECFGTMPPLAEASCRSLLNHMSTSYHEWTFGDAESADVGMPYIVVSRE